MRQGLRQGLEWLSVALIYCGGAIILIQAAWITYGVFQRYVRNDPDGMVTEATALMLVPVAFLGLAFALRQDAYPKVTIFTDRMPPSRQRWIARVNVVVMTVVGVFFTVSAWEATIRAYHSGASSEILLWPKFYFWAPVAMALMIFTAYALLKCVDLCLPEEPDDTGER